MGGTPRNDLQDLQNRGAPRREAPTRAVRGDHGRKKPQDYFFPTRFCGLGLSSQTPGSHPSFFCPCTAVRRLRCKLCFHQQVVLHSFTLRKTPRRRACEYVTVSERISPRVSPAVSRGPLPKKRAKPAAVTCPFPTPHTKTVRLSADISAPISLPCPSSQNPVTKTKQKSKKDDQDATAANKNEQKNKQELYGLSEVALLPVVPTHGH